MSGKEEESLSALVDGELSGASEREAVDHLMERADLRERWARYHMVRAVLRREIDDEVGIVLASGVRVRLADEPAHAAPAGTTTRIPRAVLTPIAGVALAASVATVAILGVRGWNADAPRATTETLAGAPAARAQLAPLAASPAIAMGTGEARLADFDGRQHAIATPARNNRLDNRYVIRHSEYGGGGMRGMHPYARIVGHEAAVGAR